MTYELAKQLKDAGFPQKFPEICEKHGTVPSSHFGMTHDVNYNCLEFAHTPTLSELIEACGENVGVFRFNATEANAWKNPTDPDNPKYHTGKTPEEAVAKLWLELNKK